MKTFTTLFIQLFIAVQIGLCCSFLPDSFCDTANNYADNLIVSGYITDVDEDGINFEIVEVLRGEESKSNIRIWDGTDFDCNGIFSMAAADLGDINQNLIIILPKIVEIENTWDVIGDYRRPDTYIDTPALQVEGDQVNGLISGQYFGEGSDVVLSFDYDAFVSAYILDEGCSSITRADDIEFGASISIYPNPAVDKLNIISPQNMGQSNYQIVDQMGRVMLSRSGQAIGSTISIQGLKPGLYFLMINNGNQDWSSPIRFVKH